MSQSESSVRSLVRLLLRISRAGARTGWTTELLSVWDLARELAIEQGIGAEVVDRIRGTGLDFEEILG